MPRQKSSRHRAAGEVFLLTSPLIGPPLPKADRHHARVRVAPAVVGGYVFVKLEFENDTGRRLSRMCC
jgi:hypothetical protein